MGGSAGPKLVTKGLVLALDAADPNSYPGSGTTWSDLTGNNLDATLLMVPLFLLIIMELLFLMVMMIMVK